MMLFVSFWDSLKSVLCFRGRGGNGRGEDIPVGTGLSFKWEWPGSAPSPNKPAGLPNGAPRRPAEWDALPSCFCSCEDVVELFSFVTGESILRRLAGGASSKSPAMSSIPSVLTFSGCLGTARVGACRLGVRKSPGRGGGNEGGRWAAAGAFWLIEEA